MSESIEVSSVIPATPEAVYKAWLSGSEHGQMTGSTATYTEADAFTAWDGYISGRTLEKQPYSRILQSWRTTEFLEGNPDSTLEILLDAQGVGTLVTLKHSGIPAGQGEMYRSGWTEHYFTPMTTYFQSTRAKINEMGHAVSEVAEAATDAFETAGDQVQKSAKQAVASVQKTARSVQKTAKKASSAVKKFVAKAKKKLAARTGKKKTAKKAAKKKARPAPKKKKAGKKRR